jgi:hypothetical protein
VTAVRLDDRSTSLRSAMSGLPRHSQNVDPALFSSNPYGDFRKRSPTRHNEPRGSWLNLSDIDLCTGRRRRARNVCHRVRCRTAHSTIGRSSPYIHVPNVIAARRRDSTCDTFSDVSDYHPAERHGGCGLSASRYPRRPAMIRTTTTPRGGHRVEFRSSDAARPLGARLVTWCGSQRLAVAEIDEERRPDITSALLELVVPSTQLAHSPDAAGPSRVVPALCANQWARSSRLR